MEQSPSEVVVRSTGQDFRNFDVTLILFPCLHEPISDLSLLNKLKVAQTLETHSFRLQSNIIFSTMLFF